MKNGVFTMWKPDSMQYLSMPHTHNFYKLLQSSFNDAAQVKMPNDERRYLIGKLLEYYALHVEGFGNIRSHEVLEEVLG
jgi:DNA repair protein RecO (recombination protein O)